MSERAKRYQDQTTISFSFAFVDSEQTTIPVQVGQQKRKVNITDKEQIEYHLMSVKCILLINTTGSLDMDWTDL